MVHVVKYARYSKGVRRSKRERKGGEQKKEKSVIFGYRFLKDISRERAPCRRERVYSDDHKTCRISSGTVQLPSK